MVTRMAYQTGSGVMGVTFSKFEFVTNVSEYKYDRSSYKINYELSCGSFIQALNCTGVIVFKYRK